MGFLPPFPYVLLIISFSRFSLAQTTIPTAAIPEQSTGSATILAAEIIDSLSWQPPQLVPSDNCGGGNGCPGSWWVQTAPGAKGGSIHGTVGPDPSVELSFTGSRISVFGRTLPNGANGLASIDGGGPVSFATNSITGVHEQQNLWTSPHLDGTQQHVLKVQYDPSFFGDSFFNRSWLQLDFFQYTTDLGTASSPSSGPVTTQGQQSSSPEGGPSPTSIGANSGGVSTSNGATTVKEESIATSSSVTSKSASSSSGIAPLSSGNTEPTTTSPSIIPSGEGNSNGTVVGGSQPVSHSVPAGAIAGGAVGGLAVLMAGVVAIFFIRRRMIDRSRSLSDEQPSPFAGSFPAARSVAPLMSEGSSSLPPSQSFVSPVLSDRKGMDRSMTTVSNAGATAPTSISCVHSIGTSPSIGDSEFISPVSPPAYRE